MHRSRRAVGPVIDFEMALFEPSAVPRAQTFLDARRDGDTSGPRALMIAVLEDAVLCIEAGRWRRHFRVRRLAAEAEAWMRCEHRAWPFSFVNICEVLGFDAAAVRARLLMSGRDENHHVRKFHMSVAELRRGRR